MQIPELRVHGVSGTAPRSMLYTDPVELPAIEGAPAQSAKYIRVYRGPRERDFAVGSDVRAFHWGGLTAGHPLTALWMLLLPFSLANVSGWTARRRGLWSVRLVRLFGLLLSGIFMNLAVIATADSFWRWSAGATEGWLLDNRQLVTGVLFMTIGAVWWAIVSVASTRSHFSQIPWRKRERLIWSPRVESMLPPVDGPGPERQWEDPAGSEITDESIWKPHAILHRLRRIHFGFGLLVLAFSAGAASNTGWTLGGFGAFDLTTAVVSALLIVNVATLLLTNERRTADGTGWLHQLVLRSTALQPLLSMAGFVFAVGSLALTAVETGRDGNLGHLRDTSVIILAASAVLLVSVWIAAGKISASASTFGVLFGLIMGAAAALAVEEWIGGDTAVVGLDWVAVGILAWLMVAVCVAVWMVYNRLGRNDRGELWDAIHETTGDLSSFFIWMPATALALVAAALWTRCTSDAAENPFAGCFQTGSLGEVPAELGLFAFGLAIVALALTVVLLLRARRTGPALLVGFGVPIAFFLLRTRGFSLAGVQISLATVESTARSFAILLPATLVVGRIIGGFRGGEEGRRGTGVLWDVLMFWPRWFHPLAPPAYGPHAIERLEAEMRGRLKPDDNGRNRRPLILSSHSQGTVISTLAVGRLGEAMRHTPLRFEISKPGALDRLGLLTYGCPVDHLYNTYFPSAGFTPLAAAIAEALDAYGGARLSGRWSNLHRPTDPIGGPLLHSIDVWVDDPTTTRIPSDPRPTEADPGEPDPPPEIFYRIHSTYEPTDEFREQRERVRALIEAER